MSGLPVIDALQARRFSQEAIGGKAASLSRLAEAGVKVPGFFVLPAWSFEAHLEQNGIPWPPGGNGIARGTIPPGVAGPMLAAYARLTEQAGHGVVAVRSSAADEDSAHSSFAGQFLSVLGVAGEENLVDAVRECWASAASEEALAYRRSRRLATGTAPRFAVIVQSQVFADKAGVLFTRHPLEPAGDLAYLEANFGTGESVAGGMVTPDSVAVSRSTGKVVEVRIGSKKRHTSVSRDRPGSRIVDTEPALRTARVLSDAEAEGIVRAGLDIEAITTGPQDIEWALDTGGLWIVQSRPQTGPGR